MSSSISTVFRSTLYQSLIVLITISQASAQSATTAEPEAESTTSGEPTTTTTASSDNTSSKGNCEYDGSLGDYLSCAKNKISTPILIGAGIGITVGIFLISFLCIWLTKKKRRKVSQKDSENNNNHDNDNDKDFSDQGIIEIELDSINKDLEKNPISWNTKDLNDRVVKWEDETTKTDKNDKSITVSGSINSITNVNSKSNGLYPKPSLKIKPSSFTRKGSTDHLYTQNDQPLKHAPSVKRPREIASTYHPSINGSIHYQPPDQGNLSIPPDGTQDGQGTRSGSPIPIASRDLSITNNNPKLNSLNPFSGSNAATSDLATYTMSPQPPPPPTSSLRLQHKPQMPLRGVSKQRSIDPTALPPIDDTTENPKEIKSKSSMTSEFSDRPRLSSSGSGHKSQPSDDGRSGTFGPKSENSPEKEVSVSSSTGDEPLIMAKNVDDKSAKRFESPCSTPGFSRKGSAISTANQINQIPSLPTSKSTTTIRSSPLNPAHEHKDASSTTTPEDESAQVTVQEDDKANEVQVQPQTEINASSDVPSIDSEIPIEKVTVERVNRRKEVRQTNLIPTYYMTSQDGEMDDEEVSIAVPVPPLNVEKKSKKPVEIADSLKDEGDFSKNTITEKENQAPNPFSAAFKEGSSNKETKSERSKSSSKERKEKRDRKERTEKKSRGIDGEGKKKVRKDREGSNSSSSSRGNKV
ncbi:uncharacterized protein L201_000591 [Kwoniella dendrophila CBS 6074]|uniref:Uncharacterized protein n=1 Tax=Kwoniella dendrophila CBS 6074 TaxID=1295534 RepID=A0AAX4JMH6_9TREE